jgi:glycosyltransferase involved in cell wall biosynthesis
MEKCDPTPFFSIVIPALNEEKYIPHLLLDLSQQTFSKFEVIIVDAKSEDQTTYKAQQFSKNFDCLTIIDSDMRNVSHQRNAGAKNALADWIIFLDADDRLPDDFLQKIKYLTETQKPDFLSTWFEPDSEDVKNRAIAVLCNIAIEIFRNTQSPLIREAFVCANKKAFLSLGGFSETIPYREGSDLLKRAYVRKMKFIFHREPKFVYSYRRLRKQGAFRIFINNLQIEIARLTNHKLSERMSKTLYPMEGGRYFEISPSRLIGSEYSFLKDFLKRIFKPSSSNKNDTKAEGKATA